MMRCVAAAAAMALGVALIPVVQSGARAGEPKAESGAARVADYRARAAKAADPARVWIEAAADPGEAVRLEAVNQLSALEDLRAIPALEKLAKLTPRLKGREGPHYPFDTAAERALRKLRARVVWDRALKKSPDAGPRLKAAKEALSGDNEFLKARARRFLLGLASEDAVGLLLADEPDAADTCRAIGARIRQGRRLYDAVVSRLRRGAGPFKGTTAQALAVRREVWGAATALEHGGDPRAIDELLRVLVIDDRIDVDSSLARRVREAIASFGEAALPSLDACLRTQKLALGRRNAAITVRLIGGPKAVAVLRGAIAREGRFPPDPSCADVKQAMRAHLERLLND